MTALPLAHILVLDLTAHRAGPTAVRQLADWGAQVIKIEQPGPEVADATGSRRHGFDFQNLHRNKRSMTINLKSPEGRAVFMKLAGQADVVVENYRSDVKYRLGVDYEAVRAVNPRIVYGSIAGFGQTGPDATRPGVDQIAQGMGGLMSITGAPGQGPMRVGIPIADLTSGLLLAQAILLAMLQREQTGVGQWVHTSLIEAQIFMLDFQAARWLIDGEVAKQAGNDHPTGIPTGVFPTADGHINIAASGDGLWKRFCEAIGAPELLAHPDHATGQLRSRNRKALNERIGEITRTRPSAHWIAALNKAGVPCGPINTIDQTFAEPQVQHLGIARPVRHPKLGDIKVVGQPINMSAAPQPAELQPTPDLGQHTDEVLRGLGYDQAAIEALRASGAV
ncbi:CoA transferase [Vineibacter terrae]|uniref:CoA transferase n=1 Tax=Vineibacter terrae TaxID=2586908 RepID=A0A5C8PSH6_9HYPH|nr:CaiB/BaiF CoA-transferase family protein [Vineibacter terrae]TXL78721.1 CoA transferase [Vineibacter terrae]